MHAPSPSRQPRQQGASLAVALIMLLLIALLGVLALNSAFFESLMAANSQFQQKALLDAEYLLRSGEIDVSQSVAGGMTPASHYHASGEAGFDPASIQWPGWQDAEAVKSVSAEGIAGAYTIEYLGPVYDSSGANTALQAQPQAATRISFYLFRVSALATAGKGSRRILQSYYRTLEGISL
jgi:Tfp pilus assembly protein PilX